MSPHLDRRLPRPARRAVPLASAALFLLPLRVFLAAGWIRAGVEKLIDPGWWNGDSLRGFLHAQHHEALPFFRPAMEHLLAPAAVFVAFVVMATQLWCGIAIGTGRGIRGGLRWGVVLNVAFVLAGRVNPSAFYLVMEIVLLFALADASTALPTNNASRRSLAGAGVCVLIGAAMTPFVRTLEPANVIDDPAMMLQFLALIVAASQVLHWICHEDGIENRWLLLARRLITDWSGLNPTIPVPAPVGY
jgi:uncharacterized membrane protein YphA (DoxX/SURF4 family)